MKRIPIFAANWKMNKKRGDVAPYGETLSVDLEAIPGYSKAAAQVLVFPPAIYLDLLKPTELGAHLHAHRAAGLQGVGEPGEHALQLAAPQQPVQVSALGHALAGLGAVEEEVPVGRVTKCFPAGREIRLTRRQWESAMAAGVVTSIPNPGRARPTE